MTSTTTTTTSHSASSSNVDGHETSSAASRFMISRTFAAPREALWAAWTDPALIGRWCGPRGATTTILSDDPATMLHGRMELGPAPGEQRGACFHFRLAWRERIAPERLVYVHSIADEAGEIAPSPFGEPWPRELLTFVAFGEEPDGTSKLTLIWEPLAASPEEHAAFVAEMRSMEDGWTTSFDRLDKVLAEQG